MDNELLLISGEDIPFIEAQTVIRQPKLKEIGMISEESFFTGAKFLTFSKDILDTKDRIGLEDKTDFDIFMSVMCSPEKLKQKNDVTLLLSLIFPTKMIKFENNEIILVDDAGMVRINNMNYEAFKDILDSMFCLNETLNGDNTYNPVGKRAERIAQKFEAARKKRNKGKDDVKVAIYSRYMSILAVGESKDINELKNYTVYQINDEFKRFQKKEAYDINIKARMAGATDLEDVDNWMEDIHP